MLASFASTGSFQALAATPDGTFLLSESLSLDSLSTISLEHIPPFDDIVAPKKVILKLGNQLSRGSHLIGGRAEEGKAVLTIPTAPRLKGILKEHISIQNWVEDLPVLAAPGHIPWGDLEDTSLMARTLEGPNRFPGPVTEATSLAQLRTGLGAHQFRYMELQADSHAPAHHDDKENLVFEREIILESSGRKNRLSLQVPAASMNSEMVDIMLELRELKSFFQGSKQNLQVSMNCRTEQTPSVQLPALMVSNSSTTLSLDLSTGEPLKTTLPLAARRGRKLLPPLKLESQLEPIPYPSMPTAFLFSPSTQSARLLSPFLPLTNSTSNPNGSSLELSDMISNLRTQCTALPGTPITPVDTQTYWDHDSCLLSSMLPPDEHIDDDEWSFAKGLLNTSAEENRVPTSVPSTGLLKPPTSPDQVPRTPEHGHLGITKRFEDRNTVEHLFTPHFASESRPPSPSLPLTPLNNGLTPGQPIRGILKSPKSVRFASLPASPINYASNDAVDTPLQRNLAVNPVPALVQSPSPLRQSMTADQSPVRMERREPRLSVKSPPRQSVDVGKHGAHSTSRPTSGGCLRSRPMAPVDKRLTPTNELRKRDTRARASLAPAPQNTEEYRNSTPVRARHSLANYPSSEKENTSVLLKSRRMSDKDENAARRSDAHTSQTPSSQKSRMPVPLRNILTKFK